MKHWTQSPFFPLAIAFLLLTLLVTQDGGQNAKSRLLAMRTFAETGKFQLDDHIRVTDDWSKSPEGHYYSNKAPGPMILGMPIFFVADKLHQLGEKGKRDERGLRDDPGYLQSTAVSFFMQALPFALLVLAIGVWLAQLGLGYWAILYFTLAALFGNTAVLFMNSYFGHGFAACLQLAGVFFLLRGRFALAGFCFSCTLLSDYGFAAQIPALLLALWVLRPHLRSMLDFCLGAIPAAFLWILYHWSIFGSPFAIASRFQNPTFLEKDEPRLWGMISVPNPAYLWELTFGGARGLVLSQPWLLWLVPAFAWVLWRGRASRDTIFLALYSFFGLAALLVMNASFNGWHGGATAGPRYLSAVLPCFALLAALVWQESGRWSRGLAVGLLLVGLAFRGLVYGGTLLAPNVPLWNFYLSEWGHRSTPILRVGIFAMMLGFGMVLSRRRAINFVAWRANIS